MSDIREQVNRARLKATQDLILAIHAQAHLVERYSADPSNPNVSAYLRSGFVEEVLKVEAAAYAAGRRSRGFQPMQDGIDYDSSEQ